MMIDGTGRHPRELLSPYLDGELEPDERAGVATHLERCAGCRALLDDLRLLAAVIAAEATPDPPPDLAARIGRRIDALPGAGGVVPIRRTVWRSPLLLGSMAAALAGIIVTVVWISARPTTVRRQEGPVVAQAARPSPELDTEPGARLSEAVPEQRYAPAHGDERGADDQPPASDGQLKKETRPDRVAGRSSAAASLEEDKDAGETMRSTSEPARVAANEPAGTAGSPAGEPSDPPVERASRAPSPTGEEEQLADSFRTRAGAAPAPPPVVDEGRSRSLELLDSDYRAVLSENGALSFRSGAFECLIPEGTTEGKDEAPASAAEGIGTIDPAEEVRQIFTLAAAEQSRSDVVAGKRDALSGAQPLAGDPSSKVLTLRNADAASSSPPIAARIDRLIREHYLPLIRQRCGPLPPELLMEERPAPE